MRRIVIILAFVFHVANAQNTWYVAAKSGLNLREKPDPKSSIIQLIPYGKSIKTYYTDDYIEYSTEGFKGKWQKVEYNGKIGFVFSEFIFPILPPQENILSVESYIMGFPLKCGPVTSESIGTEEGLGGESTKRYLTTNGIYYYEVNGYEYSSFTCILPSFNLSKGFHLIRMFDKVKKALGSNDDFPTTDLSVKLDELETFTLKITRESNRVTRLQLRWEGDGYPEQISIYVVGDGIAIEVESGSI